MRVRKGIQRKKENTRKKETYLHIKNVVFETTKNSTVHGLPSVVRSQRNGLKLMWLIFFLVSFGVSIFFVVQSIHAYFKYEVVTKISEVYEYPTKFPTVSFCSINQFTTNYSAAFARKILTRENITNVLSKIENNFLRTMFTRYFLGANARNPEISDEERKKFGKPFEDMLISCTFGAEICNTSDFEWFYDTVYGNCFKFNGAKDSKGLSTPDRFVSKTGFFQGLQVELLLDEPNDIFSFSMSAGAHVFINNKTTEPIYFEGT
jgi:hypothetical protein